MKTLRTLEDIIRHLKPADESKQVYFTRALEEALEGDLAAELALLILKHHYTDRAELLKAVRNVEDFSIIDRPLEIITQLNVNGIGHVLTIDRKVVEDIYLLQRQVPLEDNTVTHKLWRDMTRCREFSGNLEDALPALKGIAQDSTGRHCHIQSFNGWFDVKVTLGPKRVVHAAFNWGARITIKGPTPPSI